MTALDSKKKKTIEETYQKLSQKEHILKRPGMYIGDIKKQPHYTWFFDKEMKKDTLEYSDGFVKIFDEILTNALDHSMRDSTLNQIKVSYDEKSGIIEVYNNGEGIPVVIHSEHKIYVPELIFGHLLSGSNYDDTVTRTGAGTNGLGSNCTNIFSKWFKVETVDHTRGLKFEQTYENNMNKINPHKITKTKVKGYTKISFLPDYQLFSMKGLEKDTIKVLNRRVYDCVMCSPSKVKIYLNEQEIKGKGIIDYVKFFTEEKPIVETIQEGDFVWEYAIIPHDSFEQISFVNGNCTLAGGKHVDYVLNQVVSKLKYMIEQKKKIKDIKAHILKDNMFLFLRATVKNPQFNSQTKETLTTNSKDFGIKVEVSDKFVEKIYKTSIVEDAILVHRSKQTTQLAKQTDGKKLSKIYVPKLEDALWAGTAKSDECSLILTEGLSAMTFAIWGRSVVGNEKYGIFPLKGKCVSTDTKIPLYNGEIKLAKDIKIGDILIGDDGKERNVITLYKGNGKMYEIHQDRGDLYKVNDEHILTLCLSQHKRIFWEPAYCSWKTTFWDKTTKSIKIKQSLVSIKVNCKECKTPITLKCMRRHYKRRHKEIQYAPYKVDVNLEDKVILQAYKKLEDFLNTIDDDNIIDINIQDYLKIPFSLRRKLSGIRGDCVQWDEQKVLLDPYMLGLWLGDGCHDGYAYSCDAQNDPEIIEYIKNWCLKNNANINQNGRYSYNFSSRDNFRCRGESPLKKILEKYNLVKNKHIPKEYLLNSKENRLKLLAGLIDTDGYVCKYGTIEISQSVLTHERLANDIVYLCRSLGFYTCIKKKITNYNYVKTGEKAEAYIIKISGDTSEIPTILQRKRSKSTSQYNIRKTTGYLKINEIPDCDYIGIGIDGNNRFLINDFTVTHNCLNVRDASVDQLTNNEEINNIKKIIGLKHGEVYKDTKSLRYGKVIMLTDADVDGKHILGLFINFVHHFWPSLVKLNPSFIQTIKTPIVKAIKNKKAIEFFTEKDFRQWAESENITGYQIRYFKGLGTSTKEDAKALFKRIAELKVDYYRESEKCEKDILLAFDKDKNSKSTIKCSDLRKQWLSNYDKNSAIELKQNKISYEEFINKELIHFSVYDNLRSIPSICDGLKPSQRKILYYMLKKNLTKSIKVAQLSGYVSAETGYHHGEASLQQAIISMAQDFIGTNNINLLYPDGNFGSRLAGIADAASPRYIFTYLRSITFDIFPKEDMNLLEYLEDDGMQVEPEWFIPVIPMILVNGCSGIGTGYSTYIPPHNPLDIIKNLLLMIDNKEPQAMFPYFKDFKGEVLSIGNGEYELRGVYNKINNTTLEIKEIPSGTWITSYKEFLESLVGESKKSFSLLDVKNLSKDENSDINFRIQLDQSYKEESIVKNLKLYKKINTNNMYLFNKMRVLTKYNTSIDILKEYFPIRLEFYQKRREYLLDKIQKELDVYVNKIRFIEMYIESKLDINRKSKEQIHQILTSNKFMEKDGSFDYLVSMPIYSLSKEKIESLNSMYQKSEQEKKFYESTDARGLWKIDLKKIYGSI